MQSPPLFPYTTLTNQFYNREGKRLLVSTRWDFTKTDYVDRLTNNISLNNIWCKSKKNAQKFTKHKPLFHLFTADAFQPTLPS